MEVIDKMFTARIRLQKWHKVKFGVLREKIQALDRELDNIQNLPVSDERLQRKW